MSMRSNDSTLLATSDVLVRRISATVCRSLLSSTGPGLDPPPAPSGTAIQELTNWLIASSFRLQSHSSCNPVWGFRVGSVHPNGIVVLKLAWPDL
ncbi:hypothetical protein F5B18DRAFT_636904 [Nemania serpens]|nr:hypothetical protein F5B18DRAFT_636904 [Nemania serpens]